VKQYKSRFLRFVSVCFLVFPILYITLGAILFDISLSNCVAILLSPFYYIVSFLVVCSGYGLWEMRRWSWYVFIVSQVLVFYENALFVLNFGESHHKVIAFLAASLFQVALIYRVAREIRVPYFFPRIRWWESNPRYRFSAPVKITRKNGDVLEGEILDIALSGCFIKCRGEVAQDELLVLHFQLYGTSFECPGTLVWCAQSTVTHPRGIGVKFNFLSKSQRRSLRAIQRLLKKISQHYRRFRYLMNTDDFLKNWEEIESLGQFQRRRSRMNLKNHTKTLL
jgi:hypothetical protein